MKRIISILLGFICALVITLLISSCAVKPRFLVEEGLKTEAQEEITKRQYDWNWKNRQRFQKEKREFLERTRKEQEKMRIKRNRFSGFDRRSYRGIGRNTYNQYKRGQNKHLTPKRHNGVKVHKRNYWSKTNKHPQEEN